MPTYYALVDAMTGREADVENGLRAEKRVLGVTRVKDRNHDFLIKFDAASFTLVDEFLQTHIRRISGVAGVEIIVDWQNHSDVIRDAAAKLA
ncbi:MAG TPA: hypothetical protein VM582_00120 [Candidatus Thermoplasmatota archaeon]|nr:hypothetical protein [Candidatus Thermoplasmatota archaeon]